MAQQQRKVEKTVRDHVAREIRMIPCWGPDKDNDGVHWPDEVSIDDIRLAIMGALTEVLPVALQEAWAQGADAALSGFVTGDNRYADNVQSRNPWNEGAKAFYDHQHRIEKRIAELTRLAADEVFAEGLADQFLEPTRTMAEVIEQQPKMTSMRKVEIRRMP